MKNEVRFITHPIMFFYIEYTFIQMVFKLTYTLEEVSIFSISL